MITDKLRTCVAKWGLVPIVVTMLALGGCQPKDGDRGPVGPEGAQGPQGPKGDPGTPGQPGKDGKDLTAYDLSKATVTILSAAVVNNRPQVVFEIKDAKGVPYEILGQDGAGSVTFFFAKLAPRSRYSSGYDWFNYNISANNQGLIRGTGSSTMTAAGASLENLGNGQYRYTFGNAYDLSKGYTEASSNNSWMHDNTGRIPGGAIGACEGDDLVWLKDGTAFPCGVELETSPEGATMRVIYDPNLTHRIAIQVGAPLPPSAETNAFYDFVPATGQKAVAGVDATRDIVDVASCNNCHDDLLRTNHAGNRRNTGLCVTCHNPGHYRTTGRSLDFKQLIHSAHRGLTLPSRVAGFTDGYGNRNIGGVAQPRFANLAFPVSINGTGASPGQYYGIGTCVKCHMGQNSYDALVALATGQDGNANTAKARIDAMKFAKITADGDLWRQRSVEACSSCHDNIQWWGGAASVEEGLRAIAGATPAQWSGFRTEHPGGVSPTGTEDGFAAPSCSTGGCHGSSSSPIVGQEIGDGHPNAFAPAIHRAHLIVARAEVRSTLLEGQYKDGSYDAANKRLNFKFRVFDHVKGGALVNGQNGEAIGLQFHVGFIRDGYADYTTKQTGGNNAGQPINAAWAAAVGANPVIDPDGYYNVSIDVSGLDLPANDFTLAVSYQNGAQGNQWAVEPANGGIVGAQPRARAFFVKVGDPKVTERRFPVNFLETCRNCHLRLGMHGGNRNDPQLCTLCHNPQLTDIASAPRRGLEGQLDGKLEESEDFKRLIHAIHGSGKRTYGYQVRGGGTGAFTGGGNGIPVGGPLTVLRCEPTAPNGCGFAGNNNTLRDGQILPEGTPLQPGDVWYAFSRFPSRGGSPSNCNKCHVSNSYSLPIGQWGAAETRGQVIGSSVRTHDWNNRDATNVGQPNYLGDNTIFNIDQHLKMSPTAAVCSSCHDTEAAAGHMRQNGGIVPLAYAKRMTFADGAVMDDAASLADPDPQMEACQVCHGPGRIKDLAVVHKLQ